MTRLARNIVYNFLGQGMILVLGFVAVRFIFKQLGEDSLGIIYFTFMMNALLCEVLDMGISSTTVREVSAHYNDDPAYIHGLLRTASLFYWGIYALLGLAIYFLAPVLVQKWINLKSMDVETAIHVMRVLAISSFMALPRTFYASLFRGLQRMEFNNFIDVVSTAFQQFGIILILALKGSLFHVVYWIASWFGLRVLAYIYASTRFFPPRALLPGYSSDVVRRNLGFALRMTATTVFAAIHRQADKVIISKLMPIASVGYYGVAHASVSKGTLLTSAISKAAYPAFSELFRNGDRRALMAQYRKLQDFVCYGIAPVLALIPFAAMPLFTFMFNEEAAGRLLLPVTLLCIGFYMNGTMHIPHFFALAVGKPGISARSNLYALFVVLPATVLLIRFLGLTGAGLSWIFYHIFAYSYAVPRICRECLGIPVWKWYWHVLKVFCLIGAIFGIIWFAVDGDYSILHLGAAYAVGAVFYLLGASFMISPELREILSNRLQAIREKLAGTAL